MSAFPIQDPNAPPAPAEVNGIPADYLLTANNLMDPPAPQVPQLATPAPVPGGAAPPVATDGDTLIASSARQAGREMAQNKALAKEGQTVANNEVKIADAEQKAMQPVYDQQVQADADNQHAIAKIQQESQPFVQQHMLAYQATADELGKMISEKPRDMWEAAGVNKIAGWVGLILGGIGSAATGGPNVALQRLDTLVQRSIEKQKMKAELLQRKGGMEMNMYGMARQKLGDDISAQAALHNAALGYVKSQLDSMANTFKTPKAMAAAQQFGLKLDGEIAANNQKIGQAALGNYYRGIMANMQSQMLDIKGAAAAKAGDDSALEGFRGQVPKAEHPRLAKLVGGSRAVIQELNHLQELIKKGADAGTVRDFIANNSMLITGLRDFAETGTRLEPGEQALIDALKPGATESFVPYLADVGGLNAKIEATKKGVARITATKVTSSAPNTIQVDPTDRYFGGVPAEQQDEDLRTQARRVLESGVPRGR